MVDKYIPYGHHWIEDDDIQAVVQVLLSDKITQGDAIGEFESAIAAFCQAQYAVAVSSATAGLHLAAIVAGVNSQRGVVTSPNTFVASGNIAFYCGGRPYFVDIDPKTYNMSPDCLEYFLSDSEFRQEVGAIVPVHFAGQSCDMESISEIARKYSRHIIEDASHALGASWTGRDGTKHLVGSCSHSDMTVFSMHPVKNITTGEGGVILTNSQEYYELLLELRSHGITKRESKWTHGNEPWYYEMQALGYNYRITDFQCALGLSQLKKLKTWIQRRHEIALQYDEALRFVDEVIIPYQNENNYSAYHLYPIQVVIPNRKNARHRVFDILQDKGIGVQVHYIPVYRHPYYQEKLGYGDDDFPVASLYYSRALSLPIFPRMSDNDVKRVIAAVKDAVRACL